MFRCGDKGKSSRNGRSVVKLVVCRKLRDLEVELREEEAWLKELVDDILPRGFWLDNEWSWIVQERGRTRAKIKGIKKELSMA